MKKRIVMYVESPNKIKTIKQLLKGTEYEDTIVMASVGHISEIKNSGLFNMGIDVNNNFKIDYQITPDKKDIVKKLKEQADIADIIYLASDPDREGEAIAWSLKKFLKIPENKYKRITFHEITKKSVLEALNNPRKIDENLVNASQSRQVLDKIVGYRLSHIVKRNINALSVGRCQSAGLKLIVDREKEIQNFKPEKYYDLYLIFNKNNIEFKAKYVGTDKKIVKQLTSRDECENIGKQCFNNNYIVKKIETKEILEYPRLPFCTSTFQQEVSKQLGIGIKDSMSYAQKLFEGIEINNQHIALITYIRTDDTSCSPEFLPILKNYIIKNFGEDYYTKIKKGKKSENTQEGHECLRVIDLEMTPIKISKYIKDSNLLKVYTIIYNRTLACSMSPAKMSNTEYSIYNKENKFILNSKELMFEGYKKIYNYNKGCEEEKFIKETFKEEEILQNTKLQSVEKTTNPPKRYSESSFIKELDKQGIGRPSTYATIIETLISKNRGYCVLEDKFLQPTKLGIELSEYLDQFFSNIINLNYTSKLEKDLDKIANGKSEYLKFLDTFYTNLDHTIKNNVISESHNEIICECPKCHKGQIVKKLATKGWNKGKYFYACNKYPNCKNIYNKLEDIPNYNKK